MFKKVGFLFFIVVIFAIPLFYSLGNDMVAKDDFHFKNWSYVFMKEFESGNYDRLYVSVQPGVLTVYSNIVGFKSLYFAKDRLGLVSAEGKDLELPLHTAQKIPKSFLVLVLGVSIVYLLKKMFSAKFALMFGVILAFEPYLIGQSRVIQTDILPMYLGFLVLLLLVHFRRLPTYKDAYTFPIGVLTGLAILEKSLFFVLFVVVVLDFLLHKNFKSILIYALTVLVTMVLLFPAFWADFFFTLYRITIGSFIFGVQGLDTETFTYEKTHHIQPWTYYFNFLLHKVSEFVWLGIILLVVQLHDWKKYLRKENISLLLFPVLLFSVLLLAEKKIGRYTVALFPYLLLVATFGYYKLLNSKKGILVLILVFMLGVRVVQLVSLFPDFLMYQNPIAFETGFDNSREDWGTGRKKLAQHLVDVFGADKKVYATDHTTLYLFYPGEVLSKDELQCDSAYDLIVTQSSTESVCDEVIYPTEKYTLYDDLHFYVYFNQ